MQGVQMEGSEHHSAQPISCRNPTCALEKKVLEDMIQTMRNKCQGSCASQLQQLKEEMANMKRDMQDLMSNWQERVRVVMISPSYPVGRISGERGGTFNTLLDRTRIVEEQLGDIARLLEEIEGPNHNILAPTEVENNTNGEEQQQLTKSPIRVSESVSQEQRLQLIQEKEPTEGQNETQRQHDIEVGTNVEKLACSGEGGIVAESVLGVFPMNVLEKQNLGSNFEEQQEQMKSPCRVAGSIIEVTEQQNHEQLQASETRNLQLIEVRSNIVELAREGEGGGSTEPSGMHEIFVSEQEPMTALQNAPTDRQLETEQPTEHAEPPSLGKSPQQDLQTEEIVSNLLSAPNNLERVLNEQYIEPNSPGVPFDHIHSVMEIEATNVDVPKTPETNRQEQANKLSGGAETHPYQEQHSDCPIQEWPIEVEIEQRTEGLQMQLWRRRSSRRLSKPDPPSSSSRCEQRPELPLHGQPQELRIARMVEEIILPMKQQQMARHGLQNLIPCQPTGTANVIEVISDTQQLLEVSQPQQHPQTQGQMQDEEQPQHQRRKRYAPITDANTKLNGQKLPHRRKAASKAKPHSRTAVKASKAKPSSDTDVKLLPLDDKHSTEQQQLSEDKSQRRPCKRKLGGSLMQPNEPKKPKRSGQPRKTKLNGTSKQKQTPKHKKPRPDLVTALKAVVPFDDQQQVRDSKLKEIAHSTKNQKLLIAQKDHFSQDKQVASKPNSKAVLKMVHWSLDDQQQGSEKPASRDAEVLKEWLDRRKESRTCAGQ